MQAGPGRWGDSDDEMYAVLSVFIFSKKQELRSSARSGVGFQRLED